MTRLIISIVISLLLTLVFIPSLSSMVVAYAIIFALQMAVQMMFNIKVTTLMTAIFGFFAFMWVTGDGWKAALLFSLFSWVIGMVQVGLLWLMNVVKPTRY